MRTELGPEGDIRSTDILAGLVSLWRESASGTLQFSRSGATCGFDLASGEIVSTSASDARFDTAEILVRAGKLDSATLVRLTAGSGSDRALTALQAGVLTKREWRWGEKIRAVEILSDLLTWIEGDYTFFRSSSREGGEFRLTIPRLILELFLRSRDRGLVLHHLGGADVPLVRDARFDEEFATFGLTDDAESVVRLIDGESTAADISAAAPAEAFAVEKLLAALVTLGLVHPAYAVADETDSRPTIGVPPRAPEAPPEEPEEIETEEKEPATSVPEADVEEGAELQEEDDEELEPEVDVEDKVEESPSIPADDFHALGEEVRAAEESPEGLVDADLGSGSSSAPEDSLEDLDAADEAEQDAETEAERLAADLEATQSAPDDFGYEPPHVDSHVDADVERDVEADTHTEPPSGAFDFQKPLDTSTGVGSLERPRHRSSGTLFMVLGMLVAATAAVLYWRSRGPADGGEGQPLAVAAASPSPTFSETSMETPVPERSPAPAIPVATAPIAAPTRVPTATVVPSARPTARPARPTATQAPRSAHPRPRRHQRRVLPRRPRPARARGRAGRRKRIRTRRARAPTRTRASPCSSSSPARFPRSPKRSGTTSPPARCGSSRRPTGGGHVSACCGDVIRTARPRNAACPPPRRSFRPPGTTPWSYRSAETRDSWLSATLAGLTAIP